MTSPSEIPSNGSTAQTSESTTNVSPPSTPKVKNVQTNGAKVNGHRHNGQTSLSVANGNGVGDKSGNGEDMAVDTPAVEGNGTVNEEVMAQNGMEDHIDEIPSSPGPKRDLYVGNLHPRVQPHVLKDLFGGEKEVESVKIVPDRNLSHGGLAYGFVTMFTRESAEFYLNTLQNQQLFGLELRINWATPTKSAEQGLSVFVGDIGPDVTVDDLREAFEEPDQPPADARIVMDPTSGRTKGYGFVTFPDSEAATRALSKNGEILKGRKMRVNWASTTKDTKSASATGVMPQQQQVFAAPPPPPEVYMAAGMIPVRNEVQVQLSAMAQYDGLDVGWYMRLPAEVQAGIMRVSQEAPGAKVVWVGNLEKGTNQMELAPLFSPYGTVEEITMVSPNGYAFVSMTSHLVAATLIVIYKEFTIKGRKIKTGWSHSTQRQLQQQQQQQVQQHQLSQPPTHPAQMLPHHHRGQQPLPQQMSPLQPPAYTVYPQQQILYNPYIHPYSMMPPHGILPATSSPGNSTPRSGAVTPATSSHAKETPSPR